MQSCLRVLERWLLGRRCIRILALQPHLFLSLRPSLLRYCQVLSFPGKKWLTFLACLQRQIILQGKLRLK